MRTSFRPNRTGREKEPDSMKYRNAALAVVASSTLLALTGCSALTGGDGDDGGNGTEGSPVGDEIRSWDPCEVLDNNQPIVDFMQIPEINSADGKFTSAAYGTGLDAQALTCGSLVIASTYYEELYDETGTNEGEVSVGIIPWDTKRTRNSATRSALARIRIGVPKAEPGSSSPAKKT